MAAKANIAAVLGGGAPSSGKGGGFADIMKANKLAKEQKEKAAAAGGNLYYIHMHFVKRYSKKYI
jgi:hypothetical protein